MRKNSFKRCSECGRKFLPDARVRRRQRYAEALVIGTPSEQLVDAKKPKVRGISNDENSRMEKEMEILERDYRLHQEQEQFGENSLHLNGVQRYVKRLLDNVIVKRFLANRFPKILEEFHELATLETL